MESLSAAPPGPAVAFAAGLRARGAAPALLTRVTNLTPAVEAIAVLTYAQVADLVDRAAVGLAGAGDGGRRLVLTAVDRSLDGVVAHLAALAAGHVSLLSAPGEATERLVEAFDPDIVCARDQSGAWVVRSRRAGTAHDLHPDLAVLLSTSGSTGAPRLVRLSHENIESNAEAIAESLGLTAADRAVTTLPLHYCYGLSVLHSHLAVGASVVLTEASIVDEEFARVCASAAPTTVAGVPYTFELAEQAWPTGHLPWGESVRLVTQAGGRLTPDAVCRWAGLGARVGFDFVVMYGQTEATARMAVLPPGLALRAPHTVGRAVPGGELRIDRAGADGVGDLVYSGPNVMLGYAATRADLALGRVVDELETGDRARWVDGDLVEIVGRATSFAKVAGKRLDLDEVTGWLAAQGLPGLAVDLGDRLGVLLDAGSADRAEGQGQADNGSQPSGIRTVRDLVAGTYGVPRAGVVVVRAALPRLPSGKPDRVAVTALLETAAAQVVPDSALLDVFRAALGRPDATGADTFVGLGGDSLSYVEVAVALSQRGSDLPRNWHELSVDDLVAAAQPREPAEPAAPAAAERSAVGAWARVEASVVLRLAALLLVLVAHSGLLYVPGGAHALLAVAGFNAGRFQLAEAEPRRRVRNVARSVGRIFVPAVLWAGAMALVFKTYSWPTVLMVNQLVPGDPSWQSPRWNYWFIESLAYVLLACVLVSAVPTVNRALRVNAWAVAMSFAAVGLVTLWVVPQPPDHQTSKFGVPAVMWLFALGWSAAAARHVWQRVVVSGVLAAVLPGMWPGEVRHPVIVLGLVLVLIWVPTIPLPRRLVPVVATVAGASLYIYVVQFAAMRVGDLGPRTPVLALLAIAVAVVLGLAYWRATTWAWTSTASWAGPWARRLSRAGRGRAS